MYLVHMQTGWESEDGIFPFGTEAEARAFVEAYAERTNQTLVGQDDDEAFGFATIAELIETVFLKPKEVNHVD